MLVLIGTGAHGSDIADVTLVALHLTHHSAWRPDGYIPQVIIGINDPQLRAKVAAELSINDLPWIHPSALVTRSTIGHGTHVNYRASMTRTRVGNHCTISPGVTICGDVEIGDRVLVGAGAVICDRVTIGDDVVIGAGTVITPTHTCPSGSKWVGNPARPL